ncbi:MAG: HD domain-containing protein [Chloroflexi bacterium]|nr:HD domain-containing protein [Chloroflexota bacterium]MCC6892389.1 HD domain-containing protein [Anaerolineae bacterium]
MSAAYRIGQGIKALFAFSQPVDMSLVTSYLSPTLLDLFKRFDRGEQLHSLAVLRDVLAQGETPDDLAVAALLHDVGKTRYPISVWQKTAAVLVRALMPSRYQRWSEGNPLNLWQRPFVVYEQHPAWSGELLASANASEAVQWLVTHHADPIEKWQDHAYVHLLRRLQQADNQN